MIKKNIQLIIHLRSGDFYDITDMVPHVTISGSTTSVSRTLETELLQSVTDEQIKKIGLQTGSSICFYENGKELYRGNVIDIEKSTTSHGVKLTIKDLGFTLGKSRTYKNCVDATPEQVAKEVLKEYKLSVGSLEKTNFKATRYFKNTSPYEIMMTMYTFASKKNKKKYMLDVNLDKVSVIERGKALTISFTEDSNITNATHKVSIENMVSSVTVVDKNNNKISDNVNEDLFKIYRKMMNVVLIQDEKNVVTKDMINESYKGEEFTCRLTGYGDYSCKSGHKVHVEDRKTGLIGEFYIDSDKHTWSGGTYRCDLDLNFKNIMDEKESGDDKLNEPETSEEGYSSEGGGAGDWGHGVTATQVDKVLRGTLTGKGHLFIKYCNAYKIHPALAVGICGQESGAGTSKMATDGRNQFFGIVGYTNKTVEAGIRQGISLISRKYVQGRFLKKLSGFVGTY